MLARFDCPDFPNGADGDDLVQAGNTRMQMIAAPASICIATFLNPKKPRKLQLINILNAGIEFEAPDGFRWPRGDVINTDKTRGQSTNLRRLK
ncbi:hypothetical protein [Methylovirgula sp. HY1]|uniref:hypothetical protein n=1 Tax=Methylovirgula sp. HY1 TaxID=2822761 RepID=UPI001C5ABAE5|nr:hypothetical protein [Methylovirgula sp. HY1]